MKTSSLYILLLAFFCYQTTNADPAPTGEIHGFPSGQNPEAGGAGQTAPANPLLAILCGDKDNASHFDCDKVKPSLDKFEAEMKSALELLKNNETGGYSAISQSINNLIQSKAGLQSEVKDNKCSSNDGVGEDIWARDADKILAEFKNPDKIKNSSIKQIAELESMNTLQLMKPQDGFKPEMQQAVLNNRIKMYGEKLHLSDRLTKKFIETFSQTMEGAEITYRTSKEMYHKTALETAKEAGKILAIHLDSMSPYQKEELKHFANSFAKSEVDKNFRQSIQLAMNNWTKEEDNKESNVSTDGCFTSTSHVMSATKTGFLEAMKKDVASNRDDFWKTVEAAKTGSDEEKAAAKKKLFEKWGKNLPAYMQSLRAMANSSSNDAEKQSAKESLAKLGAALGEGAKSETDPKNENSRTNTYSIAMNDNDGKPTKIEVVEKIDSDKPQEISLGDAASDMRNYTLAEPKAPAVAENAPEITAPAPTPPDATATQNTGGSNPVSTLLDSAIGSISGALQSANDFLKPHAEKAVEVALTELLSEPGNLEKYSGENGAQELAELLIQKHPEAEPFTTNESREEIAKKVIEEMLKKQEPSSAENQGKMPTPPQQEEMQPTRAPSAEDSTSTTVPPTEKTGTVVSKKEQKRAIRQQNKQLFQQQRKAFRTLASPALKEEDIQQLDEIISTISDRLKENASALRQRKVGEVPDLKSR